MTKQERRACAIKEIGQALYYFNVGERNFDSYIRQARELVAAAEMQDRLHSRLRESHITVGALADGLLSRKTRRRRNVNSGV